MALPYIAAKASGKIIAPSGDVAFPCDKCGECCRHIGNIPQLAQYDDGTGRCRHLQGNTCAIYDSRPDICNVEKMYAKCFAATMSWEAFIELNLKSCQQLKVGRASSPGD